MKTRLAKLGSLTNRQTLGLLIALAVILSLLSLALEWLSPAGAQRGLGFFQTLGLELIGALVTFWLFQTFLGARLEKDQLIRDLRGGSNATAARAAVELRARGWLQDGSLRGADLMGASLAGADLANADLQGTRLLGASLRHADLQGANLERAILGNADLTEARLEGARLAEAKLWRSQLQGADLRRADLAGADLTEARLGERTILPDGTPWAEPLDTVRFTSKTLVSSR